MMMHRSILLVGLATGLATSLLWGSWAVLSRLGVIGPLDAWDVAALRYFVAGVVLLPVILRRGVGRDGIAGVPWRAALLMWLGAGAPYALIVFTGLETAPASHQAVIAPACVMVFTAAFGWIALGERLGARQIGGMAVILGGVAAIGWHGLANGSAAVGRGHLLFVGASVVWSIFTVAARAWRVDAFVSTAIVSVLSLATYVPVYLVVTRGRIFSAPFYDVAFQGVYQGLVTGVVAMVLYMRTVAALGAGRAALFAALVPGMASALAWPVLGEVPTLATLAGVVLVTLGMAIVIGRGAPIASAT